MNRSTMIAALMCCSMTMGALAQNKTDASKHHDMPKTAQPGDMKKGEHGMPAMDSAAMEAMMKAGAPGEMHAWMAKFAGTWDADCKMWMDPSAPPTESKGTMTTDMMFGGRYMRSIYKGEMKMGDGPAMPFEGVAMMGYNNTDKKFESTWMDSMSTGMMTMTGTMDEAKKSLTMTGNCTCPMTNKPCGMREVMTWASDSKYTMTMYNTMDGQETKCMEITYTKSKGASMEKSAMDKAKMEAEKKAKDMQDKMKKEMPAGK
ncbi:MAG: DUF1579 domain-containing protein [Phycisphaerales bacterium]|nr:DUF1579 domain-containing protein [Phycisphaerales bacterium]